MRNSTLRIAMPLACPIAPLPVTTAQSDKATQETQTFFVQLPSVCSPFLFVLLPFLKKKITLLFFFLLSVFFAVSLGCTHTSTPSQRTPQDNHTTDATRRDARVGAPAAGYILVQVILRSTYIRAVCRAACRDCRRLGQREGHGRGRLPVPQRDDWGQQQDREGAVRILGQ